MNPPPNERHYHRSTDPVTSREAAAAALKKIRTSKRLVYDILLREGPLTDYAIFVAHQRGPTRQRYSQARLRTARSDLVKDGLVAWTGEKPRIPTGLRARSWVAVPPEDAVQPHLFNPGPAFREDG